MSEPVVSFVVPAHNEARLLPRTLASLHAAARILALAHEIIVVDDDSDDGTGAIAQAAGATVATVRHRQIARARNAGARLASGGILVFVDADTTVDACVLRATLAAIAKGAVGGGALLRFDRPLPASGRLAEAALALTMKLTGLAAGACVFCTREAFDAVGGFDETLFATEELTLSRALRRRGPFVILRERVVTSGRKARTHSARELLAPILALVRHGPAARRRRDLLDLWYGGRRDDPREAAPQPGREC